MSASTWQGLELTCSMVDHRVFRTPSSSGVADNLQRPIKLDISNSDHWTELIDALPGETLSNGEPGFQGVIMRASQRRSSAPLIPVNLIHCCPEGYPEHVFEHLSPRSPEGRKLLDPATGWVAAYGAFKNDDGSYRSESDQEVSPSLSRKVGQYW